MQLPAITEISQWKMTLRLESELSGLISNLNNKEECEHARDAIDNTYDHIVERVEMKLIRIMKVSKLLWLVFIRTFLVSTSHSM